MHIWNIALKEIKLELRDPRTFFFMLLFPIVLMLILGTALSNAFTDTVRVEEIHLLYKNDAGTLAPYWTDFLQNLEQEGIHATGLTPGLDGREQVQNGNYTAYAEIDDRGIRFYGNNRNTLESNILQGILTAFADRVNLTAAVMEEMPEAAQTALASDMGSFIQESGLDPERKPNSMDYYGLVMTTMIVLYGSLSASMLIRGETVRKTALRLSAAPVRKSEIFTGKVIGGTFTNTFCFLIVVLFSKYVFHTNWGDHLGIVLLVLFSEVIMAVSLGLGFSFLFSEKAATAVLMIFIQLASFFGGAYFPLQEVESGVMAQLISLSPLYWINNSLTELIYNDAVQSAFAVIGLNLAAAAVLLVYSAFSMHRREAV